MQAKLYLRREAPSTSLEAAQSLADAMTGLRAKVLDAVRAAGYEGLTADELEQATNLGGSTIRPRILELRELGYVVRTDRKRKTASGRQAYVYVAGEPPEVAVDRDGQMGLPL
jgi:predicted transcriptional regulator